MRPGRGMMGGRLDPVSGESVVGKVYVYISASVFLFLASQCHVEKVRGGTRIFVDKLSLYLSVMTTPRQSNACFATYLNFKNILASTKQPIHSSIAFHL